MLTSAGYKKKLNDAAKIKALKEELKAKKAELKVAAAKRKLELTPAAEISQRVKRRTPSAVV